MSMQVSILHNAWVHRILAEPLAHSMHRYMCACVGARIDAQQGLLCTLSDSMHACTLAETIGTNAMLPTADVSTLASAQSEYAGPDLEVEELPENGVLWNLDRIVRVFPPFFTSWQGWIGAPSLPRTM